MITPSFKTPLSGSIPPLVTPLKDTETLDIESLERLIEHLIAGGVHGLFVLGTTGEEQSLSYDVRKQMIKESCRINRGRLPLLACITDTSIEESIRLAKKAADYGADGVVSAPPTTSLQVSPSWLSSTRSWCLSCRFPCSYIICLRT